MKAHTLEDLASFNEKANVLHLSSFADAMLRNESGFLFEWRAGSGCEDVLIGAEGESVDAAFLTVRMFIQKNDRISIANIGDLYASDADLKPFESEFTALRIELNQYLDQKNGIDFFGKNYTNREAIELVLYGSKGHTNRAKEAELKEIMDCPSFISGMFKNVVNAAVANLIRQIMALAQVNEKAMSSDTASGILG